jgi:RNA polymerase sigma factor (sigma-70 family)
MRDAPSDGGLAFRLPSLSAAHFPLFSLSHLVLTVDLSCDMKDLSPEHELLRRYLDTADGAAFGALVQRYFGLVLGTAQRITEHRHLAEEVAQDVFTLLAARASALLRGLAPLAVWLHRTTRYKALRARQAEQRRARNLGKFMHEIPFSEASLPDWQSLAPQLDTALNQLSAADREVLLLHYYQNLPHTEIATRLGVSHEAIRQRATRAVQRLGKILSARSSHCVSNAALTVLLSSTHQADASTVLAETITQSALAAAPSVPAGALFTNLIHTMNFVKATSIACVLLGLLAIGWQETVISSTRQESAAVRANQSLLNDTHDAPSTRINPKARSSATLLDNEEPGLDEITAESVAKFARELKRSESDLDVANYAKLKAMLGQLTGDKAIKIFELAFQADISATERVFLLNYLHDSVWAHASLSQRVELMTKAWLTVLATDRKKFAASAADGMIAWAVKEPQAAADWYLKELASGRLSPGFSENEPATQLAGMALFGQLSKSIDLGREFIAALPAGQRGEALQVAGYITGSLNHTKQMIELAKTLPSAESVAPLGRLAAQLAYSESAAAGMELFVTIPFQTAQERATAALDLAQDAARNKKNPNRPKAISDAWSWLNEQTADSTDKTLHAKFLATTSWGDPQGTLARFDALGGLEAGQEALSALLVNIPGNDPKVAARYFQLSTLLQNPTERDDVMSWAVKWYRNADPVAAKAALEATALPADLKQRIWSAH